MGSITWDVLGFWGLSLRVRAWGLEFVGSVGFGCKSVPQTVETLFQISAMGTRRYDHRCQQLQPASLNKEFRV